MKTQISNFVAAKKATAIASGKEYATAKGKEMAYRSINGIMAHPQFQKLDEMGVEYINSRIDFTMGKLDKIEAFNKNANTKTLSLLDKIARVSMVTGIIVASMGLIGGTLGAFLTTNFFWLILSALSLVALGAVIGAGVSYFKTETGAVKATAAKQNEIKVPAVANAIANLENKLSEMPFPELKAA